MCLAIKVSGGHFYLATQTESTRPMMQLNPDIESTKSLRNGKDWEDTLNLSFTHISLVPFYMSTNFYYHCYRMHNIFYLTWLVWFYGNRGHVNCIKLRTVGLAMTHSIIERKPG